MAAGKWSWQGSPVSSPRNGSCKLASRLNPNRYCVPSWVVICQYGCPDGAPAVICSIFQPKSSTVFHVPVVDSFTIGDDLPATDNPSWLLVRSVVAVSPSFSSGGSQHRCRQSPWD